MPIYKFSFSQTNQIFTGPGDLSWDITAIAEASTGHVTGSPSAYTYALNSVNGTAYELNGQTIQSSETITGIELHIWVYNGSSLSDIGDPVQACIAQNLTTSTNLAASVAIGPTRTEYVYGSSTQLWGLTWTASSLQSVLNWRYRFQFSQSGVLNVDGVEVWVYTSSGKTPNNPNPPGSPSNVTQLESVYRIPHETVIY